MIDLIAAAGIGGIIGAGIMAWRTHGRVAFLKTECDFWKEYADGMTGSYLDTFIGACEKDMAHDRCADALTTKTARIERALEQVRLQQRPNATVQRIARILKGDA